MTFHYPFMRIPDPAQTSPHATGQTTSISGKRVGARVLQMYFAERPGSGKQRGSEVYNEGLSNYRAAPATRTRPEAE